MQTYLVAAGAVAILVGLIHSILGEVLIFRRMRERGVVPTNGRPVLKERHVRILWASWHIVTIFGWAFAAVLLELARLSSESVLHEFIIITVILSMFASSVLVLFATKGMHPGWVGLLVVAGLCWLA